MVYLQARHRKSDIKVHETQNKKWATYKQYLACCSKSIDWRLCGTVVIDNAMQCFFSYDALLRKPIQLLHVCSFHLPFLLSLSLSLPLLIFASFDFSTPHLEMCYSAQHSSLCIAGHTVCTSQTKTRVYLWNVWIRKTTNHHWLKLYKL